MQKSDRKKLQLQRETGAFSLCFAAQECDAALFLFEKLFDSFQFILSRTKADLFRLIKGCLPFNIWVGIFFQMKGWRIQVRSLPLQTRVSSHLPSFPFL